MYSQVTGNRYQVTETLSPVTRHPKPESGNVFFIILIAIALFAALSFVIARGFQSDTGNTISKRKADLAASEVLEFAQRVERGVNRVRRNGVSESNISFDDPALTGYGHGQPDAHKVFLTAGGAVRYNVPPSDINDGSDWHFTGATCIADVGTGATGCNSDADTSNEELLIVLNAVAQSVCEEINDRLEITGIPADSGGGASTTEFVGSFADGTENYIGRWAL